MTYGWHTSTYEWHKDDIRVHTNDIRMAYEYTQMIYEHMSDIWMIYEHIRVTYEWHTSGIRVYTIDIQIAYEWLENDIRNIKLYKGFGAFRSNFQNFLWLKHCFRWLQMIFGYYVVPIPILFIRIFLSSTLGSGNLNNLKGGPYYIL